MTYSSGAAFRRALEDRLLAQSLRSNTPLVRLRKLVAFDRFLARLVQTHPGGWLLKGGGAAAQTGHAVAHNEGRRYHAARTIGAGILCPCRGSTPRLG